MKKKNLLGLFLVSIFVFGVITPLVAADAYKTKNLIPEEAIGIKTQSEVKTYNNKGWAEDISDNVGPRIIYGGNADVEGAQSQGMITVMEERTVDLFDLMVVALDLSLAAEKNLMDSKQDIRAGVTSTLFPMSDVDMNKEYEIWYIEMDTWDYSRDDLKDNNDNNDIARGFIFQDPEDIRYFYDEINFAIFAIQMSGDYEDQDDSSDDAWRLLDPSSWNYFTGKDLAYMLLAAGGIPMAGPSVRKYLDLFMEALQEACTAGEYVNAWTPAMGMLLSNFGQAMGGATNPYVTQGGLLYGEDTPGYYGAMSLAWTYGPGWPTWNGGSGGWWNEWEFIDTNGVPEPFDKTIYDVELDGLKITIEYGEDELLPIALDSMDGYGPNQYYARAENDFNIEITYSAETGGRSGVKWIAEHDDEVLYELAGLPVDIMQVIPGYALSIVLLASAITAIGMIYIVMKKIRK